MKRPIIYCQLGATILMAVLLTSSTIVQAQAPGVRWAIRAGGSSDEVGTHLAADRLGNVYVTGNFAGLATFGETTLASRGDKDIFIAKYDRAGRLLWARQGGGSASENAHVIAVDGEENCYVTGVFNETAQFERSMLTSGGLQDIYIAKYDRGGQLLWAKRAGGPQSDAGIGIALDSSGHCYVTGHITGSASFGAATLTSKGLSDLFIGKFDSAGNVVWVRQAGGTDNEVALDIAVDVLGNSYVVGRFEHTASLGNLTLKSRGRFDAMVAKFDSHGTLLWAKQAGGAHQDIGRDVAVDSEGHVYVMGTFEAPANFGGVSLTTGRSFLAKYNPSGDLLWVRPSWGSLDDEGYDLAVDAAGNPFVTYGGRLSSAAGLSDVFVSKYNGSGAVVWTQQFGGGSADFGHGIAIEPSGAVYVTGRFLGTGKFGTATLQSRGSSDIYVAKIGGPPELSLRRASNGFVLTWPAEDMGFILQESTALGADASWTDVPRAPSVASGSYNVTVEAVSQKQFFRLRP